MPNPLVNTPEYREAMRAGYSPAGALTFASQERAAQLAQRIYTALDWGFTPVTVTAEALGLDEDTVALVLVQLQREGRVIAIRTTDGALCAAKK